MTSATMRSSRTGGRAEGYGFIIFASILLLVLGFLNLIDGIAAIAQSHIFIANAHYVLGDLRAWGWIALILGILQLLAGAGAMAGNQLARWTGVALVSLNLIAQMFFLPGYPFWSLMIIAIDVVALWALCVYGSRENLATYHTCIHPHGSRFCAGPLGGVLAIDGVLACQGGYRPTVWQRPMNPPPGIWASPRRSCEDAANGL